MPPIYSQEWSVCSRIMFSWKIFSSSNALALHCNSEFFHNHNQEASNVTNEMQKTGNSDTLVLISLKNIYIFSIILHKRLDMRRIEDVCCWAPNIFTVSASTQSLSLSSALQIITYYANTIQVKFCKRISS